MILLCEPGSFDHDRHHRLHPRQHRRPVHRVAVPRHRPPFQRIGRWLVHRRSHQRNDQGDAAKGVRCTVQLCQEGGHRCSRRHRPTGPEYHRRPRDSRGVEDKGCHCRLDARGLRPVQPHGETHADTTGRCRGAGAREHQGAADGGNQQGQGRRSQAGRSQAARRCRHRRVEEGDQFQHQDDC